jgi:hypothetical protein
MVFVGAHRDAPALSIFFSPAGFQPPPDLPLIASITPRNSILR